MGKKTAYIFGGIVAGIIMTLMAARMIPIEEEYDMTAGYQGKRLGP